jgi:lysine 2,3-aminomutase
MGPRDYHDLSEGAGATGRMIGKQEVLRSFPELSAAWDAASAVFPVRITRSWWARARTRSVDDPLLAQVLPSAAELTPAPGDLDDPVGDRLRSPVPWVVHKHNDRVLLLLTKRCHVYCRYCFRRTHDPGEAEDPDEAAWEAAMAYAVGCGAHEAILSGGDPLAVRDERLFETMDRLKAGGIRLLRLHTRAPISAPSRVDEALVRGLAARAPVWVVVHCNHPSELSPEVDEALARMIDAGIPVLNQSVLLRGVNDRVEVLEALSRALVERRVRPYYLHHTDPVTGNAAFRVNFEDGLAIHRELARRLSGYALPRYVIDPADGSGKIDVPAYLRRSGLDPDGRAS